MLQKESNIKKKIFKPAHSIPGDFTLDYILLPYGQFYQKTRIFLEAKRGDILRFFNGPEVEIDSVGLVKQDKVGDSLCRMRYGIPLKNALRIWCSYATLEGHSKDVISKDECLIVFFKKQNAED